MTALLLILACGESPEDSAPLDPAPYIVDEADPPQPQLDLADIEAAITEAVVEARRLHARPVIDGYGRILDQQEPGCPDYYSDGGNTYWYDYCYTSGGAYFSGYGFLYEYDAYDAGDGYLYTGTQVYTVADLTDAEGHAFSGSGAATDLTLVSEGGNGGVPHTLYYSILQGTFRYDGPEAEGTWLDLGYAPDLTMLAYDVPVETSPTFYGRYASVTGGVGGLGEGDTTVVLDGVVLFEESLASTCPEEPAGMVSVREPSGNWFDVLFDGPAEIGDASDGAACDGCGRVYYRGELQGEACVDFSALLDWEDRPW